MRANERQAKEKVTTPEQAYHSILAMIVSADIPPGSPLRIQELANTLNMSMTPIRDALRRLEAVGVVEIVPYRGAQVRNLSTEDLVDTYRTRISLEGLLCSQAAENFLPDDAKAALAALDEQQQAIERSDLPTARAAHREFHYVIYRAAGSEWMLRSIEPTWLNSERYRIASELDAESLPARRKEHEAILEACVRHKPAEARKALRAHLLTTVQQIDPRLGKRLAILTGGH